MSAFPGSQHVAIEHQEDQRVDAAYWRQRALAAERERDQLKLRIAEHGNAEALLAEQRDAARDIIARLALDTQDTAPAVLEWLWQHYAAAPQDGLHESAWGLRDALLGVPELRENLDIALACTDESTAERDAARKRAIGPELARVLAELSAIPSEAEQQLYPDLPARIQGGHPYTEVGEAVRAALAADGTTLEAPQ